MRYLTWLDIHCSLQHRTAKHNIFIFSNIILSTNKLNVNIWVGCQKSQKGPTVLTRVQTDNRPIIDKCIGDDMKGAASRSPNCIKNTKNTLCGRGYLLRCKNYAKNCFPTQNFTEIGQSTAQLWPKKRFFSVRPPFWILKIFIFSDVTAIECQIAVVYQISSKLHDFCRTMLCISAVYAVVRCPSVRPSVCLSLCHVRVFCRNEQTRLQFFH